MSNFKKHSLLILVAMLVLLVIPMSFAADVDNNATAQASDVSIDDVGISDVDDIQTADELEYDTLQYSDDSDELQATSYDYESTPTVDGASSVSYTLGESTTVNVAVESDYLSDFKYKSVYAWINGESTNNRYLINGVYGGASSFTFDLQKISDKLVDGENTITFHIEPSEITSVTWDNNYKFNPLTVIVGGNEPEIKYTSTPSVDGSDSVQYLINDHATVTINVESDLLDQFESYDKLYAWIGDEYKQINVMANEASATVDLKVLSDEFGFEEGQTYTIYFHPDLYDLNYIGIGDGEYVFNPLIVEIIGTYTPEPTVVYTSTPKVGDDTTVEYIIGEDTTVTVTVVYDESYGANSGFSGKKMRIFINDDTMGTIISDVNANATSFTINLADYITSEGTYDIRFSPGDSTLSWVFYGVDNYVVELNNLTVTASEPVSTNYDYESTPDPLVVDDYVLGDDKIITVTVVSDYLSDLEGYGSMFAWINGEDANSRYLINGVDSGASSFTLNLADISDKLVVGTNTITFHPTVALIEDCSYSSEHNFVALTVVASEPVAPSVVYETNVTPSTVDYVIGESSVITVTATFDPIYSEDLEFYSMFVYINGEEIANRVAIDGVTADATSFEFDLATIADKLVVGENTLTFHPHPGALEGTVTGDYVFNPLTVVASEPVAPSVVYETNVTPSAVDYVIGESSIVTVTATFDSIYAEDLEWYTMFVYINGEETDNRVAVSGVYADATSFEFDLATIADKLVVGENTLTFHPNVGALEGTVTGEYVFNPLTVTATKLIETSLAAEDLVMTYQNGTWIVTLTDEEGNAISDAVIKIGINVNGVDKVYNRKTDSNGVASLPINLISGEYAVNATFEGDDTYGASFADATITVNPVAPVLLGEDLEITYKNGSWSVTLTDANGNAISNVVVKIGININGVDKVYNRKTDDDGVASLPINVAPGEYAVNATFDGNKQYAAAFVNATVTVAKAALTISADDVTMGYKDGSSYKVTVVDAEGNAVANIKVKFTLGTKDYNIKTDSNGVAELPINLLLGDYTITATVNDAFYESNEISNAITVTTENLAIIANDVNMTYQDGTAYEVQLIDGNGNPVALAGQIVKVTVKGKTYDRKTDVNGIASLPINLGAGTYDITAEYNGIELTNNVTVVKA